MYCIYSENFLSGYYALEWSLIEERVLPIFAIVVPLEEGLCKDVPLRQVDSVFAGIAIGGIGLYAMAFIYKSSHGLMECSILMN